MMLAAKIALGLVVAIAAPCFGHEPVTLSQLKDRAAAEAATPEGRAYLTQFFTNPFSLALDDADELCRAAELRSGSHEAFVIALRVGANGYPIDALVSPDDEGMRCVADRLKATGFIKPPHDGFAIYMPFEHVTPGTGKR